MATTKTFTTSSYDGRYYQLTLSITQSVANNTSTISWTLEALGGNASWYAERTLNVSIGGTSVYSKSDRVERYTGKISSGSTTVTHESNGTKTIAVEINAAVYVSSVNCKLSTTYTLPTIARQSSFGTISGNTLGSNITVNISRNDSSFTHQFWYKVGDSEWYEVGTGYGTSVTFKPDIALCSQFPNSTSGTMELCIRTLSGSTKIGKDVYKSITAYVPDSVKPSVSISVSDATSNYGTYGAYIQSKSKISVTLTGTTAYDSPIASYSTTIEGVSYAGSSFTSDVISGSGTIEISTTVKDKRGRTGTNSTTISVTAYTPPSIDQLAVKRCNSDGTENDQGEYVKVIFSSYVTGLSGNNTATYELNKKASGDTGSGTTYTLSDYQGTYIIKNATYITFASSGSSYNIQLEVTDNFSTAKKTVPLSTASTLMHWKKSGNGMAVGKISEYDNVFDVGFKARFTGGIDTIVLTDGTSLDKVLTPNTYYLFETNTYSNAPVSGVPITLEIFGDESNTIIQRATAHSKTNPEIYERCYNSDGWSSWFCISGLSGSSIGKSTNLNSYTTPGRYFSASATISASLSNCPYTSGPFELIVEYLGSGGDLFQRVREQSATAREYIRSRISGTWSTWMTATNEYPTAGSSALKIGTYNGSNLYRKVVQTKMSSFVSSTDFASVEISLGFQPTQVVRVQNVATNGTSFYELPYFSWNGTLQTFFWNVEDSKLTFRNKAAWGSDYTLNSIIEYVA